MVAALPYLKFGESLPITRLDFIRECENWLTAPDLKVLLSASIDCAQEPGECNANLKEWEEFDNDLRDELVKARGKMKTSGEFRASGALEALNDLGTPLLMEEALEGIRWDFVEAKSHGQFFNLNWLVFYYLKLQIMERLAKFEKDKGETLFYKLCEVGNEKSIG